jgi:hypothetical protein
MQKGVDTMNGIGIRRAGRSRELSRHPKTNFYPRSSVRHLSLSVASLLPKVSGIFFATVALIVAVGGREMHLQFCQKPQHFCQKGSHFCQKGSHFWPFKHTYYIQLAYTMQTGRTLRFCHPATEVVGGRA